MSLIYQALRRLGEEERPVAAGLDEGWERAETSRRRRWRGPAAAWLLAGLVGATAVAGWMWRSEPEAAAEELAGPATESRPEPLPATPAPGRALAERAAPESAAPVPAPEAVPKLALEPGPGPEVRSAVWDAAAPEPAPEPDVPPEVLLDSLLSGRPVPASSGWAAGEGPAAPEASAAPRDGSPAAESAIAATAEPLRRGAESAEASQARRQMQATLREKSLRISRLTVELTQAANTLDEVEVERLLAELETEAGAESSYYLNLRAFVELTRGRFAEVEKLLGLVLARSPDDANANLNMAVAESRTGRLREARRRLERLTLVHPDDERIPALLATLGGS